VPQERCDAGQSWVWDGVHFEMLHPPAGDHALALRPNALSCVLRVQAAGGSLLLSGDIEAGQEAALLERQRARLPSAVLLVPHHGSRTSSSAGFVDAVAPRVALVQAAYRGRFGHPAPEVVARYEARGTLVVRSDECGAWTLGGDGAMHCERQRRARYWHHRPH
jgi:competence protein ComEC